MAPIDRKTSNKLVGRIVPIFLTGVVAYATYVFVAQLCVYYLLQGTRHRPGTSAALLTIYFVLFLLMAITYGRLVYIITVDPGYLPLGPAAKRYNKENGKRLRQKNRTTNRANDTLGTEYESSETAITRDDNPDSPGLELFYTKDLFVCSEDGRPKWCSECATWKPDRTHHCGDVGRCVYKMDHFCPWVGGVVGEHSFKFFVQFVAYAFVYCLFVLVVTAVYLSESLSDTSVLNGHFVALLVLSGLFGLFAFGMTGSSLQFVLSNLTTIENYNKRHRAWLLAVLIPPSFSIPREGNYPHITYPLSLPVNEKVPSSVSSSPPSASHDRIINEPEAPSERDAKATRTFAILQLGVGLNPFDLGAIENWKSVMGNNFLDWVLPIKQSPCRNHESHESQYKTGRWVEELLVEVGFMSERDMRRPQPFTGRKRRNNNLAIAEKGKSPIMTSECIPRNTH